MTALLLVLALLQTAAPATDFDRLRQLFDYDRTKPAGETLTLQPGRHPAGTHVYDFSFDSPEQGRVPGLLVVPAACSAKRCPVILYSHWMWPKSPWQNKTEFLDEALVMARAGAMSVLLDAPLVRTPKPRYGSDPEAEGPHAQLHMTKDWRRALDLVLARPDADPTRVAFVGHSFGAGVGAKLAGVDKRIGSFVLIANQYSLIDFIDDKENAVIQGWRKKFGEQWLQDYLRKFPWDDAKPFAQHAAPAAVFLQYGKHDRPLPPTAMKFSLAVFPEP